MRTVCPFRFSVKRCVLLLCFTIICSWLVNYKHPFSVSDLLMHEEGHFAPPDTGIEGQRQITRAAQQSLSDAEWTLSLTERDTIKRTEAKRSNTYSLSTSLTVPTFGKIASRQQTTSFDVHAKSEHKESHQSVAQKRVHQNTSIPLKRTKKQYYIFAKPLNRLGNQMFVYASAYGIAARLKRTLAIPSNSMINEIFNITALRVRNYSEAATGSQRLAEHACCTFDKRMFQITKDVNYTVGYFLQSWRYFEHVASDIRKQFTFNANITSRARKIIQKGIKSYLNRTGNDVTVKPVLVGVHVRRGDMVNNGLGFNVASAQYLHNATAYFRSKFPHVMFLVCSDDMRWTHRHLHGRDVFHVKSNFVTVDLAVLAGCDHSIITVGTVSWWAGFLTRGITLYYQWPARNGTRLRSLFSKDYSDYFMPNWIGLGD